MGTKAYILLDIVDGKSEQVARALRGKRGVLMADPLESSPDVIMVVQASDRQELAKLTVEALTSVETFTEGLRLLPAKDGLDSHVRG